jgi:hypothetical protein
MKKAEMAPPEANETTSLLAKDPSKPIDPSLTGNGLSSGNALAASGADADDAADVESGEVGNA